MTKIVWNEDTTYGLFIFRIITWPTGTWPLEERTLFAKIRCVTVVITLSCFTIILLLEIAIGRTTAAENIDCLMLAISIVTGCVKLASFQIHAENMFLNYTAAIKDYATIDTSEKRDVMRRHAFMGRVIGCTVVLLAYICGAFFLCSPYIDDSSDAAPNSSVIIEPYSTFPLPSTIISSILKITPITYGIICVTEFLILTTISTANTGSDCFFLSSVLHVCGQIQLLKQDIANCNLDTDKAQEILETLISRHSSLLILAKLLSDTISTALLVQLFVSCTAICIIGLQCILSLNTGGLFMQSKSGLVLITLLAQLWSYSYVGDYLKTQTEDVGIYIYSSAWYALPPDLIRNLVFVIMRSQEPVQLTAAQFVPLNMETYMSILKTSASYLSVLRVMLDA